MAVLVDAIDDVTGSIEVCYAIDDVTGSTFNFIHDDIANR